MTKIDVLLFGVYMAEDINDILYDTDDLKKEKVDGGFLIL